MRVCRKPIQLGASFAVVPESRAADEWSRAIDEALAHPGAEGVGSMRLEARPGAPFAASAWRDIVTRSDFAPDQLFWTTHAPILEAIGRPGEGATVAWAFQGESVVGVGSPRQLPSVLGKIFAAPPREQFTVAGCLGGRKALCEQCVAVVELVMRDHGLTPERVGERGLPHDALERTRGTPGLVLWSAPVAPEGPALLLAVAGREVEVPGGCSRGALNMLWHIAAGLSCFNCTKPVPGKAVCVCGASNVCAECLDQLATTVAGLRNLKMQAQPLMVPLMCDTCNLVAELPAKRVDLTRCGWCASPARKLKRCAGCELVAYCGAECQRLGWHLVHSAVCKHVRA